LPEYNGLVTSFISQYITIFTRNISKICKFYSGSVGFGQVMYSGPASCNLDFLLNIQPARIII